MEFVKASDLEMLAFPTPGLVLVYLFSFAERTETQLNRNHGVRRFNTSVCMRDWPHTYSSADATTGIWCQQRLGSPIYGYGFYYEAVVVS